MSCHVIAQRKNLGRKLIRQITGARKKNIARPVCSWSARCPVWRWFANVQDTICTIHFWKCFLFTTNIRTHIIMWQLEYNTDYYHQPAVTSIIHSQLLSFRSLLTYEDVWSVLSRALGDVVRWGQLLESFKPFKGIWHDIMRAHLENRDHNEPSECMYVHYYPKVTGWCIPYCKVTNTV